MMNCPVRVSLVVKDRLDRSSLQYHQRTLVSRVLVGTLPGATLLGLAGLQDDLESLLGVHVDLLMPGYLPPKLRAKVLAEAQPV